MIIFKAGRNLSLSISEPLKFDLQLLEADSVQPPITAVYSEQMTILTKFEENTLLKNGIDLQTHVQTTGKNKAFNAGHKKLKTDL